MRSEIGGLDEDQRRSIADLRDGEPPLALRALTRLRSKANRVLVDATVALLDSPDADVRCAAAGNLGTVASTSAVESLKRAALGDTSDLVRIEAGLALNEIGTEEARSALSEYLKRHAGDRLEQLI